MIDVTARLGAKYCRVLSGQRREDVSRATGCAGRSECITSCWTPRPRGVVLNMENHYKDGYWRQPEFAQRLDVPGGHRPHRLAWFG